MCHIGPASCIKGSTWDMKETGIKFYFPLSGKGYIIFVTSLFCSPV